MRRAQQLKLEMTLHDVLRQVLRLTDASLPQQAMQQLTAVAGSRLRNRMMDALLALALRPDHPDCDTAFTGMARWMLYVRSHWLRMPWHQIIPHLLRKSWRRFLDRKAARSGERGMPGLGL